MSFRNTANLISRLLLRENWPAGDGDRRKLLFYLFPQLGSLLLLLLIAWGGLWIVSEEHVLRDGMAEVANSPYMAILIEGYMYGSEGGTGDGADPHEPAYWRNLTLDTLLPNTAGSPLGQEPVFESVSVYSNGYLSFLDSKNQQVSGFKGLVLDFVNSERRNERLLDGLREAAGEKWRWNELRNVNGIIMSGQLMESLGYAKPWPRTIGTQKDDYGHNDPQGNVTFPVVVLDELPYRRFTIPRRMDILADFASLPPSVGQVHFDGDGEPVELSRYDGAMLYLNQKLVLMDGVQNRLIPALRGFINRQVDQKVHSEILEVLGTALSNQAMLQRLSGLFTSAAIALAVILALYNAVVLHSRVYRIGVLREQGASARLFVMVFLIQSLLFTLLAFVLALLIHVGLSSQGLSLAQLMGIPEVGGLFAGLSVAAVVGYVVPAIVFINLMEPAEMVSYRA